jgi:hypothetical protein
VKQSRISKWLVLLLPLAAISLWWDHGVAAAFRARTQSEAATNSAAPPQQLSAEGQASLRAIVKAGNLTDLRWPDFSDYSKLVNEFYESYGYSLPWVRGMEPTPQARQAIALLLKADQKGLSAEDYDGPRWSDRLAKLKPIASKPTEADALQYDAALTICVMRYVSDLHIGKVNPKHFDFGFDVEAKKYDLPGFLKKNVVDAPDVAAALIQAEPPYPGYWRTIRALQTSSSRSKMMGNNCPPYRRRLHRAIPIPEFRGSLVCSCWWATFRLARTSLETAMFIKARSWMRSRIFSAVMAGTRMEESPRKHWPI